LSEKEEEVNDIASLMKKADDLAELAGLTEQDDEMKRVIEMQADELNQEIDQQEIKLFLNKNYDRGGAVLEISSGAGGREAEDWVAMLTRMYQRYSENQGWKTSVLDQSFGEPGGPDGRIGLKKIVIEIQGRYAFGYLKGEGGVHRLVRISPFSDQQLRHTSFALVEVLPILPKSEQIEINPADLRVDTYRASGPGGQYVNKTESAIRITHLPTKIQVACQAGRSQGANREMAMKILEAKLYQRKKEEESEKMASLKSGIKSAAWGKQIRSYILQPYQLIKDYRTEIETSNVLAVLEGELDEFIKAEIKLNND
jgi:peptide chain release factor 2